MLDLQELQAELAEWAGYNFPARTTGGRLMGATEEVGELAQYALEMVVPILHVMRELGNVNRGYISYSDDKGKTWTIIKNILFDGLSNFRVMSFIQNHHTDNPDGFVYILGQAKTLELLFTPMQIYLVRVDQNQITNPNAWEFFAGIESGLPIWSPNEADSKPLDDLQTIAGGYSMYHKGLDRYLFFTPLGSLEGVNPLDISFYRAGLYESQTPYGDWKKVANMQAGFMSALIPAYYTNDEIWVTGSNYVGKNYETEDLYNLNVHKLILETPND